MKFIYYPFCLLLSVIFLFGCEEDGKEATLDSNLTFIKNGDGGLLESNKVLLMNFRYETDSGVVLTQSEPGSPMPMMFNRDTTGRNGQFQEVMNQLSIGDSVTFNIPAYDLFQKTFRQPVPANLDSSTNLKFRVGIVSQMSRQEFGEYQNKKIADYNAARLEVEKEILSNYTDSLGVSAQVTESGLHYVVTTKGGGPRPENGQKVSVKYKGTLLDGTLFDQGEYAFVLGSGEVIKGWDEGISYLNLGSKGVLYIPSTLGYGQRGSGVIPPQAPLVFEVELVKIN